MTHVLDMFASMECTSLLAQTESLLLGIEWKELLSPREFSAGVTYFWLGAGSTTLFILRILLMIFGGDFGADADVDVGGAGDALDSTDSFGVLSLISILAFGMGTGWGGMMALYQFEMGSTGAFFVAILTGIIFMIAASSMMFYLKKLDSTPTSDPQTAVGKTGSVYMSIPAKGEGAGQVEITVSGRKKVMPAVSESEAIESFKAVTVVSVRDDNVLVVKLIT